MRYPGIGQHLSTGLSAGETSAEDEREALLKSVRVITTPNPGRLRVLRNTMAGYTDRMATRMQEHLAIRSFFARSPQGMQLVLAGELWITSRANASWLLQKNEENKKVGARQVQLCTCIDGVGQDAAKDSFSRFV